MIEVIYKEEKKEAAGNEEFFRIPRNIRQIGESGTNHKIYIEDYVYTFLNKVAAEAKEEGKVAVLLGRSNWQSGVTYIFIRGAVLAEGMDAAPEKVAFTDEIWTALEEREKECFPDQEVVGWFFAMADLKMEISDSFYRAHVHYFGGNDKVLFFMEPLEKEEAFFLYETGHMVRQSGYYIYYEKNQPMQEYMLRMNRLFSTSEKEEVEDRAVVNFRRIITGKKKDKEREKEPDTRNSPAFVYAVSACLAAACLAVGVNYLNNYQKMQRAAGSVRETIALGSEKKEEATDVEEITVSVPTQALVEKENALSQAAEKETAQPTQSLSKEPMVSAAPTETPTATPAAIPTPTSAPTPTASSTKELEIEEETGAAAYESYAVQFGDSLYKISMEKYGDMGMISEICEINGISTEDIIYPGQIILLP